MNHLRALGIILISLVLLGFISNCDDGDFIEMKENVNLIAIQSPDTTTSPENCEKCQHQAILYTHTPVFTWTTVNGAHGYELTITGFEDASERKYYIENKDGEENANFTIPDDELIPYSSINKDGTYQPYTWSVKAKNYFQYMPSTEKWDFYILDNVAPTIEITIPKDKAYVSDSFEINVNANDNSGIAEVSISIDGKDYVPISGSNGKYTSTQTEDELGPGVHKIKAKVKDIYGNEIETEEITIYINPKEPTTNAVESCSALPDITWNAVTGATQYELEVYTTSDYSGTPIIKTVVVGTSYTPSTALANANYYWRVRAVTVDSDMEFYSDWVQSNFTISVVENVNLTSPANTSVVAALNVTFTWDAVAGANSYDFELNIDNSSFSSPTTVTTTGLSTTISSLSDNHKYYWRVRAHIGSCIGNWTQYNFDIDVFDAPVFTSPFCGGNTCTSTPNIVWNNIPGATGYEYQFANNSSYSPTIDDSGTSGNIASGSENYTTAALTTPTVYYFRARATDGVVQGVWGECSFTLDPAQVDPTSLTNPTDDCENTSFNFSWSAGTGINNLYDVQYTLSSDVTWASTVDVCTGATATNCSSTIATAGTYKWRVRSRTVCNNGSYVNAAGTFEVKAIPSNPTINGVADICSGSNSTITWTPVGGQTYDVEFWNGSSWLPPDSSAVGTATKNTPTVATGYKWRIRTTENGCTAAYTESVTFEVKALPSNPTLNGIANICTGSDATVTWTTAAGETYDVDFWNGSAWATPSTVGSGTATQNAPVVASGYKWRINTTKNGCTSSYTESGTFEVFVIPTNPTINGIADICTGNNATVTWTTAAGETYDIDFWNGSAWATPSTVGSGTATQNAPAVASGYKWRINTTKNSCTSSYSESGTFEVFASPTNPTINGVANICTGSNATVTWTTAASETYDIDFWNGSAWVTPSTVGSGTATQNAPSVASGYKWRINTTKSGCTSSYTESGTFEVYALPTNPTLNGVADICTGNNASVTWTTAAGETYDVDFWNGSAWATPSTVGSGTATQNAPGVASGYKWRINTTKNGCTSSYSETGTFEVFASPTNPALSGVADICTGNNSTVTWTTAAGETYDVDFWNGSAWATPSTVGSGTATQNTPGIATGYKWRINTTKSGCTSSYSESGTFEVFASPTNPTLNGIANICSGSNATVTWTTAAGETYDVDFWNGSAWVTPSTVGSGTATQNTPGVASGYKWRINTTKSGCTSSYTESGTFEVYALPTNPTLNGVADICTGNNATVTWTTAAGETYDVDFWNGSAWVTPSTVGSGTATQNTPGVASGYKWRINTTKNGCSSSYSESGTFEVFASPTNPTLNGVADICTGNNATVTWTTAAGETYDVDFWNGSAWQTPDTVGSGTATENTPSVASGYKWRINTTKNGCTSSYSETGTFEVYAIPTNPTLNGIADICNGNNATVTWTTAAGETYDVDFWNGSAWQTPDTVGSGTATENTPGVASGYKWRINTTKNGCSSSYSESGTFEVFASPTNPTLNGVADICTGNNATVTWTTAAGETYDVDFWNGSAWQTPDTVGSGTATENTPSVASGYKWRINTT